MVPLGHGMQELRAKPAACIDSLLALEINIEELMDEAAGLLLIGLCSVAGLVHCLWVSLCDYDAMWVKLPLAIARAYWELHIDTTMAKIVDGLCMYTRGVIAWNLLEKTHSYRRCR